MDYYCLFHFLRAIYAPQTTTDLTNDDTEKPIISLCCSVDTFLTGNDCVKNTTSPTTVKLPAIYEVDLEPANVIANDEHFHLMIWNPCVGRNRYSLNPRKYQDEKWYLLSNGSILRPLAEVLEDSLLNYDQYCLARVQKYEFLEYLVFFCEDAYPEDDDDGDVVYAYGMLASVPFLTATYLIYWLLPDLRNLHGLTLRGYVACLTIGYVMLAAVQLTPQEQIPYVVCIIFGIFAQSCG